MDVTGYIRNEDSTKEEERQLLLNVHGRLTVLRMSVQGLYEAVSLLRLKEEVDDQYPFLLRYFLTTHPRATQ